MFNAKGDVQWLSEGALGPDEQAVVEEAIATLTAAVMRAHFEVALPDTRAALFLAVRTPRATLAGVVMVLMDAKILNSGNLAARILTTSMRSYCRRSPCCWRPRLRIAGTGDALGDQALFARHPADGIWPTFPPPQCWRHRQCTVSIKRSSARAAPGDAGAGDLAPAAACTARQ